VLVAVFASVALAHANECRLRDHLAVVIHGSVPEAAEFAAPDGHVSGFLGGGVSDIVLLGLASALTLSWYAQKLWITSREVTWKAMVVSLG